MAFQTFVSVIFVPVLIKMTKRFDKRTMFLAGMGIAMAASVVYGIAGIPNAAQMFVYSFFLSIGSICYWQLIAAMVYDVCEDDQLNNRKERSGMVISMQSISESLSEALGLQLLGIILGTITGSSRLWRRERIVGWKYRTTLQDRQKRPGNPTKMIFLAFNVR